jgi:hypothetical protein
MAFPRTARHCAKAHERCQHSNDRFEVKWQIRWLCSFGRSGIERLRATQLKYSHVLHKFCRPCGKPLKDDFPHDLPASHTSEDNLRQELPLGLCRQPDLRQRGLAAR